MTQTTIAHSAPGPANSGDLLQDWTVRYGTEGTPFNCQAISISYAIAQCLMAYPGEVVVSAQMDAIRKVQDFVVVGLPDACQMMVDGALQTGPWFVIANTSTGELEPDLMIGDVACYLSRENAQEALEYNVAEYASQLALDQLQANNQTGVGSELEVQARKAIETNNDGLLVVPTDALDSATAQLMVEEDVNSLNSLIHPVERYFGAVAIGDSAKCQSAYRHHLQLHAPDVLNEVQAAVAENQRRIDAKDERKKADWAAMNPPAP